MTNLVQTTEHATRIELQEIYEAEPADVISVCDGEWRRANKKSTVWFFWRNSERFE